MTFHCQKDEPGYWHCNMVHVVGRRPEDAQLERELIDLFPGMLKDVRLVREGEDAAVIPRCLAAEVRIADGKTPVFPTAIRQNRPHFLGQIPPQPSTDAVRLWG
jgi:hypothetical protein